MRCFFPVTVWLTVDGGVSFVERGSNLLREISIRCGRCVGCRLHRVNSWTVRCVHEAKMHPVNSFVTLTYDSGNLPTHGSLHYPDFQLFMKRLRKKVGPVRFFMCGEYGEALSRPHYHALLFGVSFGDAVVHNSVYSKSPIYRSETLSRLWPHGHSSIGEVNSKTAAYCAGYVMKKVTGDLAEDHYTRLIPSTGELVKVVPEFARMSLKPGLGASWFAKYGREVANFDNVVIDGKEMPAPRYYDSLMDRLFPAESDDNKQARILKAINAPEGPSLDSRRECAEARVRTYARSLS